LMNVMIAAPPKNPPIADAILVDRYETGSGMKTP
jgi:hypothetical protein